MWSFVRGETWSLRRWLVEDGAAVSAGQIVAEIECRSCVAEIECPYPGTLRHNVATETEIARGDPIGRIQTSQAEYNTYLREGGHIQFSVHLDPRELEILESRRGSQSREEFVAQLVCRALRE
jgi:pyruvate/2-oxoglutarate dehydrogenase complex dihydrolipoamide acyltransferase (E2) component